MYKWHTRKADGKETAVFASTELTNGYPSVACYGYCVLLELEALY